MKKRYYVFPQLPFFVIIFSIIEMVVLILCVTLTDIKAGQQLLANIIIIFAVIFCSIQIVGIICIMWAKIGISEDGITKYLFGKKIKFFSWNEICEIKGLDNNDLWIVFCKKHIPDKKLIFNKRKCYTIPIYKRKEVVDSILQFYPKKNSDNFDLIEL